jgi:hypothetical protein
MLGALVVFVPRDTLFIWPVLEEWMPRMMIKVSKGVPNWLLGCFGG